MGTISNGESGLSVRNKLNDVIDKIEGTTDINNAINIDGALSTDTSLNIASSTTVTGILDEDNMASNSATKLATQQSIKAYVDAQVGTVDTLAEVLGNGNTTGGTNIVVSANDVISLDDGTNALPSLTTTGDLNTGIYFPAADEVGITTGGTQRVKVDSTGIDVTGTVTATGTSVFASLDISGDIDVDGTTNLDATNIVGALDVTGTITSDGLTVDGLAKIQGAATGLVINETDTTDLNTYFNANSGDFNLMTTNDAFTSFTTRLNVDHSTGDISFYEDTGSTAKFFWDASAESLGIGTSSPNQLLELRNSSGDFGAEATIRGSTSVGGPKAEIAFKRESSGDDTSIVFRPSDNGTLNATAMTLNSSGKLGIGTSSPATNLDFGVTSNDAQIINLRKNSNSVAGLGVNVEYGVRVAGPSDAAAPVSFGEISTSDGSTFAEFARIDSSGNLLVGMLSANTNNDGAGIRADGLIHGKRADVVATFNRKTSDGTVVEIAKDNNTIGTLGSNTTSGQSLFDIASEADAASNMRFLTSSGSSLSERMRITSAGKIGIGTDAPQGTVVVQASDAKLGVDNAGSKHLEMGIGSGGCSFMMTTGHTMAFGHQPYANRGSDTNFSEKMKLDASGNVGIGISSAAQKLVISGGSSDVTMLWNSTDTAYHNFGIQKDGSLIKMGEFNNDGTAFSAAILNIEMNGDKVGIGTDSPDTLLHLSGADTAIIRLENSDSSLGTDQIIGGLEFEKTDGSGAGVGVVGGVRMYSGASLGQSAYLTFSTASSSANNVERMRIDSSGHVGIGKSLPSHPLHVADSGGNTILELQRTNSNGTGTFGAISFTASDDHSVAAIHASGDGDNEGAHLIFRTTSAASENNYFNSTSERMRIDSSGNLLVATTNTSLYNNASDDYGFVISSSGTYQQSANNTVLAYYNRQNGDGEIMQFRKDGAPVGSIGSQGSGATLYIGQGDVTLGFNSASDVILPRGTDAANRSGVISLGDSNNKFNNLHLSGGIQFDARSNKLDDYEEGTWTPFIAGVTPADITGCYTKIGDLCYIGGFVNFGSTSDTTPIRIDNFPFTCSSDNDARAGLVVSYSTRTTFTSILMNNSADTANLRNLGGTIPTNADFSGKVIHFGGVYKTA